MIRAALLAGAAAAGAAAPLAAQTATPLFSSDEPLAITIQGPLGQLSGNRDSEVRRPGTLSAGGETILVQLSPRGITRRETDVCDFPPLRVDFPGRPATGLFAGQRSLKLVTHCRAQPGHQQFVLLEYAAYRIYNLLTPLSFRARLLTVIYNNEGGRLALTRTGFFIEDLDHVAARNGLVRARTGDTVAPASLSAVDAGRAALFEYLIGNLDWSLRAGPQGEGCCHNSRLLQRPGSSSYVPVPYDFDFAGLVDAPYAEPPAQIPVASVRVRRYRGYCAHNAQALAAAAELRAKRAEVVALLAGLPGLAPRSLQKASAFLDGFWKQAGSDAAVRSNILARCVSY
jgi:hypothetical protein